MDPFSDLRSSPRASFSLDEFAWCALRDVIDAKTNEQAKLFYALAGIDLPTLSTMMDIDSVRDSDSLDFVHPRTGWTCFHVGLIPRSTKVLQVLVALDILSHDSSSSSSPSLSSPSSSPLFLPSTSSIEQGEEKTRNERDGAIHVHTPDLRGRTPLHFASYFQDTSMVSFLLRCGCSAVVCDDDGRTPLYYAILGGKWLVVSALLEAGADPRTCDNMGESCIELARRVRFENIHELETFFESRKTLPLHPIPSLEYSWKMPRFEVLGLSGPDGLSRLRSSMLRQLESPSSSPKPVVNSSVFPPSSSSVQSRPGVLGVLHSKQSSAPSSSVVPVSPVSPNSTDSGSSFKSSSMPSILRNSIKASVPSIPSSDSLSFSSIGEELDLQRTGKFLGSGTFGHVYEAVVQSGNRQGEKFAVKEILISENDPNSNAIRNEIVLMLEMSHPNVLRLIAARFFPDKVELVLEYCEHGSLSSIIRGKPGLPIESVRSFTRQVLSGLQYLHSKKILHRDLKPANILCSSLSVSDVGGESSSEASPLDVDISPSSVYKLADFGCGRIMEATCTGTSSVGTISYMAPECLVPDDSNKTRYGPKVDVWSLGCTVLELLTGKHPFYENSNAFSIVFKLTIRHERPTIPDFLPEDAKDFLFHCLQFSTNDRWSVDQLLEHPFVA